MTRGDRDRAMMLQDEVSEMSGHIISFSWPLGEHGGWSWRLWDLYLAFLSLLETQEDYTSQPSQSGGATWQFLTKEICVGECFLSPWKPLLGFSSPTLESQFILSRANIVLASAKQERSVLLCFLPFGVLWMCGGKQECRWAGKRGGNLGDCAQPSIADDDCISRMASSVGGGRTLCFYCGFQMMENEIGLRKESSPSKFRKHRRQSRHDIL